MTSAGLGRHVSELPPEVGRKTLQMIYVGTFVYSLGISMVRFSAILFYDRIFETRNSRYRYAIWISLAANAAWCLTFGLLALLTCLPVHAFWDRGMLLPSPYRCLSTLDLQLSAGITSVLMDLMVLLVPLPRIWKLHTDRRKKARLLIIFILGYWLVGYLLRSI